MRAGTTRDELLFEMDVARDRVGEAIGGLSEEQMAQQEIDGWSVKDHLTHRTLGHVLSDLDFAREMVRQAVANCPEDRLDLRLLQELGPNGAGHDIAHADV